MTKCLPTGGPRGGGGGGGWAPPSNRLMGMCHWMGLHFHHWIDYNGVAFSIELLEWGRILPLAFNCEE